MKVFITGGTGFIGRALVKEMLRRGHRVSILSRSSGRTPPAGAEMVTGDPTQPGDWQEALQGHEAVVNLAGSTVFCRWTEKNRQQILASRLLTTGNIVAAMRAPAATVKTLINGSAIGYYGDCGDREINEKTPSGSNFLAGVAGRWENAALAAADIPVRVVCCRTGVVLGRTGGALQKMLPAFRWGLGCPFGQGNQWFSWIHLDDLVAGFCLVLENNEVSGLVNFTAPAPVTNRAFGRALADALRRPFFLPAVPAPLLRLVMGDTADLLLDSQKVRPEVLTGHGFVFRYPELGPALVDLLR